MSKMRERRNRAVMRNDSACGFWGSLGGRRRRKQIVAKPFVNPLMVDDRGLTHEQRRQEIEQLFASERPKRHA